MSYISPVIEDKFNTLSPELKTFILEKDVNIYTMQDLIHELEQIVSEAEGPDDTSPDEANHVNIAGDDMSVDSLPQSNMIQGD